MNKSEHKIAQALNGHFFSMYFEPYLHVVDVATTPKKCINGATWRDTDYRLLWKLKMDGWSTERCAEHMDRSACAIAKIWSKRSDWQRRVTGGEGA